MPKYIYQNLTFVILLIVFLKASLSFAGQDNITSSRFAIYEVRILEDYTVSEICDQQGLFELRKNIKKEFSDSVRDVFCIPKIHLFQTDSELQEAGENTALFIIVFKNREEWYLDEENDLIQGRPQELAYVINDVATKDGNPKVFGFEFKQEDETIYSFSPAPYFRIGGVEELSFHSGEVSYGLKAIKKLVKEWSDSRKFGLVKLVQNTFYESYLEEDDKAGKFIDGQWGKGTAKVIGRAYKKAFDNNINPDELIGFLFKDLIVFKGDVQQNSEQTPLVALGTGDNESMADASTKQNKSAITEPNIQSDDTKTVKAKPDLAEGNSDQLPAETANNDINNENPSDINDSEFYENYIELNNLKDEINKKNDLIDFQNNRIAELVGQLDRLKNSSISEIWADLFSLDQIKISGERLNGEVAELKVVSMVPKSDSYLCKIDLSQSLSDAFEEFISDRDCFIVTLEEYEEDDTNRRSRAFNFSEKTLRLPVLEKQSEFVTAIKSPVLDAFESPFSKSDCHVGLKIYIDDNPIKNNDGNERIFKIFLEENDEGSYFFKSFEENLNSEELEWKGGTLKFVDTSVNENLKQKCSINEHSAIPILSEKEASKFTKDEYAMISRDGEINLEFSPVEQIKGSTLIVFLDELVGSEGETNNGFNAALKNGEIANLQKMYFTAFWDGLNRFVDTSSMFSDLIIFSNNVANSDESFEMIYSVGSEDLSSSNLEKFAGSYMKNSFRAANKGSSASKKRFIRKLKKEYENVHFLVFGSSGLDADSACLRSEYASTDALIFDVWPLEVITELSDDDAIKVIEPSLLFMCNSSDQHFGFRSNKNAALTDIGDPVFKQLIRKFGDD